MDYGLSFYTTLTPPITRYLHMPFFMRGGGAEKPLCRPEIRHVFGVFARVDEDRKISKSEQAYDSLVAVPFGADAALR